MYEVTENLLATMALEFCPKKNAFGTKVLFPENLLVTMALEPYPKKMCSEQEYDFQENLLKALLNLRALQDCSRTSPRMLQGGGLGWRSNPGIAIGVLVGALVNRCFARSTC